MNAFISFDVSSGSTQVKQALIKSGYWASWVKTDEKRTAYHLPTNCLWKPNTDFFQAKNDIQNVIAALNAQPGSPQIQLKRCIVLSVNPWDGFPGEPIT